MEKNQQQDYLPSIKNRPAPNVTWKLIAAVMVDYDSREPIFNDPGIGESSLVKIYEITIFKDGTARVKLSDAHPDYYLVV